MRTMPLQFLTWGTITAAIGSAAWLSSADQAAVFYSFGYPAASQDTGIDPSLPAESTHAHPSARRSGSRAAKQLQASAS
jgi:hypothetical protein